MNFAILTENVEFKISHHAAPLIFRGVILKDQIKTAQEIQIIIAIIEVKDYRFSV